MIKRNIPLAVPNIGHIEEASVMEAVRSGWVSTVGPAVTEFERRVAEISGVESCAAIASGTMGLHMALRALGVGRDDIVIIPSYSFIATANSVSHAGAQPYLIDVSASSWTMDPVALQQCLETECLYDETGKLILKKTGQRVGAIMPVYTNGNPADMDAINTIATGFGIPVIADAAASIGALYKGRAIGGDADLTSFSFNGNKTLTTGGGGAVVGRDPKLVARVKHLSSTARVGTDYEHDEVGFNYRLTNLEAALGVAQLTRLAEFHAAKQKVSDYYAYRFGDVDELSLFPRPNWASQSVWFTGVVLAPDAKLTVADLVGKLNEDGIGVRTFWKPIHLQRPYMHCPRGPLPVTEELWTRVLPLPCSTDLSDDDMQYVADRVIFHLSEARR
ncbi:dTDP-4-amino-4,6-dideoxygalactose transaminase [Ciceribacter lividus]|uniref:dTDP-4-amino-4,6-dideoxygalactose transaminase n=1 Tax=Ciceribacter lividus TaxID=1197950 RepID=A0A6I7HI70_9HYPH|nr:DegT/DnrJ/EryC1/StrS family aminotransferase [Ciceribacter lividus]RCW21175.1 dTDP-4-amino-4,6-dideoxygalactose transaminase [Ciceribacter lividus]